MAFAAFQHHFQPILRFCLNSDTRNCIVIAYENRCNANVPIFREVTILQDEAARLIGYANHACLSVEDTMAKTTDTVNSFLNDLRHGPAGFGRSEWESSKNSNGKILNHAMRCAIGITVDGIGPSTIDSYYSHNMRSTTTRLRNTFFLRRRSNLHSTDMFDPCFKRDSPSAIEERRYRFGLLEKGGSRLETETLIHFLDRNDGSFVTRYCNIRERGQSGAET